MFAPQTPIFDENASTTTPSPSAPLHKRSLSTPGPQGFATPKSKAKTFGTPSRRFGANLTNTGGKQSVNRQHSVQKKVRARGPTRDRAKLPLFGFVVVAKPRPTPFSNGPGPPCLPVSLLQVAFQIPPLTPSNIYAAPSSSSARPGRSTPHRKTVSFTSAPPLGIFQDSSAAASLPPPSLLSPVETAAGRQGQQVREI